MNSGDLKAAFALLAATVTLSALVFGIAALWAARGRARWPWRVAPLALLLASLAPIGAYELLTLFGAQAACILGSLSIAGRIRTRKMRRANADLPSAPGSPLNFSLRDVLKVVLLMGLVLAILRFAAPGTAATSGTAIVWWPWVVCGIGLGFVVLSAAWMMFGQARWYLRAGLALLVTLGVGIQWEFLQQFLGPSFVTGPLQLPDGWCFLSVVLLWIATAGWLRLVGAAWPAPRPKSERTPQAASNRPWCWPVRGVVCLALVAAGGVLVSLDRGLLPPPVPPPESLPSPNGYDQLAAASRALNWAAIPTQDYEVAPIEACQSFVAANSAPLADVRTALLLPSQTPIDYISMDAFGNGMGRFSLFRSLCRALCVEGRANAATGQAELMARSRLDVLRLGRAISRKGTLVDELVGDAIEGAGMQAIVEDWNSLDGATLEAVARELTQHDATREPMEDILARDEVWGRVTSGWQGRLWFWVEETAAGGSVAARVGPIVRRRVSAHLRLVVAEAAIRQHILSEGSPPESLAALVPRYLEAVPLDPFGGGPLKYRRTDDGYLLYSVGANGADDGGQRVSFVDAVTGPNGDLFFDADQNGS